MGHVLGLRHNFAGSTEGTITLAERDRMLKQYLTTGDYEMHEDKFLSRSIMDVFNAGDDALAGAQIRKIMRADKIGSGRLAAIYRHDKEAIDFGYFDKPMPGDTAFCTDDDLQTFLDCRRWDATATGVEFSAHRLNSVMSQMAIILADTFITALDPKRNGSPLRPDDIALASRNVLKVIAVYAKELFQWFSHSSRSALVEKNLPAYGPQTEQQIGNA